MAYPAIQLITESYFLSAIVGKSFNSPTFDQLNEGKTLLNDVIAEKTVDTDVNPYYDKYTFTITEGLEDYFIPHLIEPETMTFVLNTVRYTVNVLSRKQYWQTFRANNVETLPLTCTYEKKLGGCTVFFYPLPNQLYEVTFWGQFFMTQISTLQDDLSLYYEGFYISYLKFALAARLCMFYRKQIPADIKEQLASLELQINKQVSGPDIINMKTSTLSRGAVINWAAVNFSNGWFPGTGAN